VNPVVGGAGSIFVASGVKMLKDDWTPPLTASGATGGATGGTAVELIAGAVVAVGGCGTIMLVAGGANVVVDGGGGIAIAVGACSGGAAVLMTFAVVPTDGCHSGTAGGVVGGKGGVLRPSGEVMAFIED
jgi:hypothetical protein